MNFHQYFVIFQFHFILMGEEQSARPFNFSPGPGCLPLECLLTAKEDMVNWKGTGMSVLETSHRSQIWGELMDEVRGRLRDLLNIPLSHTILFIAGGACLQFSAIPFNFIGKATKVDYLVTGHWSTLAYEECQRLNFPGVKVNLVSPMPKLLQRISNQKILGIYHKTLHISTSVQTKQLKEFKSKSFRMCQHL
jgi:phosphoserine aminotransferase